VGSVIKLHFDGILTLTHHATDLFLPTEANITTAAGDEAEFIEYATGDWRCTNYRTANGQPLAGAVTNGDSHDHSGGDGAVIQQGGIDSSAVGQGELKTATGSVSINSASNFTLPGGEYGFYPQTKHDTGGSTREASLNTGDSGTTYLTRIGADSGSGIIYAQQRYIQSSPPYKLGNKKWGHFLFILQVITTGEVKGAYEAEDPPYAYNGPSHNAKDSIERIQAVPHPFADYFDKDPAIDGLEILLVDLRSHDSKKWKADNAKKGKGILEDLGHINKKGKIVTPQELGIGNIQGFTDRVKIRKHN
jgi:hypothetical protein